MKICTKPATVGIEQDERYQSRLETTLQYGEKVDAVEQLPDLSSLHFKEERVLKPEKEPKFHWSRPVRLDSYFAQDLEEVAKLKKKKKYCVL
jgi:hypothetical protein